MSEPKTLMYVPLEQLTLNVILFSENLINEISEIFLNYGFPTEILVASIRNPIHIVDSARMGADVATLPFKVLLQLFKHPLTDIGLENFLKDWNKK